MPKSSGRNKVTLIIERLDAESRRLAKEFDRLKVIYALYGLLDGLSTSYSTLVYFFNVADTATSSADAMQDWMRTSSGVAVAATETITLVAFSFLANIFDDKDQKAFKRYIAIAWPYCRDSIKGLKNAYKGVRSSLQTVGMLSGHDLHNMIVPLGLALGVISILNRVCLRMLVKDDRVSKMKENTRLLSEIQGTAFYFLANLPPAEERLQYKNSYILVGASLHYITNDGTIEDVPITDSQLFLENIDKINLTRAPSKIYLYYKDTQTLITSNGGYVPPISGFDRQEYQALRAGIKGQSDRLNRWALLGAGYGGVVDGLYLYMGALGLTALSPPVFMAMAVCSTIFSSMCVATRVYEEYDFQRKLKATKARVELALYCKKLEAWLGAVKRLKTTLPAPSDSELEFLLSELRQSNNPALNSVNNEENAIMGELRALWGSYREANNNPTESGTETNKEVSKRLFINKLKLVCDDELVFTKTELMEKRDDVRSLTTASGTLAVFIGLRSGLAVYGAITSIMFAVATMNALFLAPFPAVFLIAGVVVGMVCLIASLIYSLINLNNVPQLQDATECRGLFALMESLKQPLNGVLSQAQDLNFSNVREAILESMDIPLVPQPDVQKWAEVFRALGSGFSKGPRLLNFLRTMWPAVDTQENDNDGSMWFKIAVACAVVQAIVFTLTAWTRGFGRDTPDTIKQPAWVLNSTDDAGAPSPNGVTSSDRDSPTGGGAPNDSPGKPRTSSELIVPSVTSRQLSYDSYQSKTDGASSSLIINSMFQPPRHLGRPLTSAVTITSSA